MTFFTDIGRTSHSFKAGIDYQHLDSAQQLAYPGSQLFVDQSFDFRTRAFVPDLRRDYAPPAPVTSTGDILALYARDKFDLGRHLLLELGLRYERQKSRDDSHRTTVDTGTVSPRMSVSYDIFGMGKSLIVATYGRPYQFIGQFFSDNFTQNVQQGCYPAHEAVPDGVGPFPAVVVAHDRFGLNPHAKSIANRLASVGFYAIAPDFYGTPSSVADVAPEFLRPAVATHFEYSDEQRAEDAAAMLSDERGEEIFKQAIEYAMTRGKVRSGGVGVLGFSMGGRLAFLAACQNPDEVRAAACFYPTRIATSSDGQRQKPLPIDLAGNLAAPLLLFFGQLDTTIPRVERDTIQERLTALGKDFKLEVFHDAAADFFCEELENHRIHDSKVAWEETLALFRRCLPY